MLQNWAERMQIPYTCLSTAKNIMNESHPLYAGVYAGAASAASTCQLVEQSDCLIAIGPRFTDVATAFFSHRVSVQNMLYLADSCLCLDGQMISGLDLAQLIQAISKQTLDDQPRTLILQRNHRYKLNRSKKILRLVKPHSGSRFLSSYRKMM